jgi:hypothetical protein
VSLERLARSVSALAEQVAETDIRAQLHALGAVLANLGGESADAAERERLVAEYERLADTDEASALDVLVRLAALDRATVAPVDWSAASGG